jgi:hypothetical protein
LSYPAFWPAAIHHRAAKLFVRLNVLGCARRPEGVAVSTAALPRIAHKKSKFCRFDRLACRPFLGRALAGLDGGEPV